MHNVNDATSLVIVRILVWGTLGIIVDGILDEESKLVCIRVGMRLSLDHQTKNLGDGFGVRELHHGGSAIHLLLGDANGTLEDVNGLNQISLLGLESSLLLGADLGGRLHVSLICGNGARELLNPGLLHLDICRLFLHDGLEIACTSRRFRPSS